MILAGFQNADPDKNVSTYLLKKKRQELIFAPPGMSKECLRGTFMVYKAVGKWGSSPN